MEVLNLSIQQDIINGIASLADENEIGQLKSFIKFFPFVIATSFNIKEKNRIFISEYIIPQLIMLACKKLGISGIAYTSHKESDVDMYPIAVNLAIMTNCEKLNKYDDDIEQYLLTEPVRFSEFLMLPRCKLSDLKIKYQAFVNAIYHGTSYEIKLGGSYNSYTETSFSLFDEYLTRLSFEKVNNEPL